MSISYTHSLKCAKCGKECYASFATTIGAAGAANTPELVPLCDEHAPGILMPLSSRETALQSRVAELEIVVRKLAVALKQDYKNGDLHQHDEDGPFHHCSVCDLEELARKALEPK